METNFTIKTFNHKLGNGGVDRSRTSFEYDWRKFVFLGCIGCLDNCRKSISRFSSTSSPDSYSSKTKEAVEQTRNKSNIWYNIEFYGVWPLGSGIYAQIALFTHEESSGKAETEQ